MSPQSSGFASPESSFTISEIKSFFDHFNKYEVIATHLSLPIGTVKNRMFFSRKMLQEILKDLKLADRE